MNESVPFKPSLLNVAPYTMWKSVGVDGELTHEQVVAGFAKWLIRAYAQMWYLQTDFKIRWYLQRRAALKAWALAEAQRRLKPSYQPTWSVWAFGHARQRIRDLEAKLELLELTIGGAQVEQRAAQKASARPPRSRAFLQAFYTAARQRLPAELVSQLETAATKGTERP